MWLKKHWEFVILFLIIVLAIFFRVYHFSDWLHFQADQARDAMVIRKAVQNGFSSLPLLGPRAGGTLLRLGPVFYYFEYLSAKTMGSVQPYVFAYPDLIFGVLAIPLFYFFLRLYFGKIGSLLGAAIYAFSFIAVQYSRYAWNPNSIPFWTLLLFFSLVKFGRAEKEKEKYIWAAVGALSLGIASQLHFLAYISLPIIAVTFLIWSKAYKKLNLKRVALVLAILAILNIPVILSEMKTGGSNSWEFMSAVGSKSGDTSFGQKISKTIEANSQYYFFLLTSYTSLGKKKSPVAGALLIAASLLLIFFKFRSEKDKNRESFLKLTFIWFFVAFLLILPFSDKTHPRFFLNAYFLPLIFFVFWIQELLNLFRRKKYPAIGISVSILLALFLITLNLEAVFAGFRSIAQDSNPKIWNNRPIIEEEIEKIPLYQLREAADYLAERSHAENKKIHLGGNMTYRAPLQYLLKIRASAVDAENMSRFDDEMDDIYFTIADDQDGCRGKTEELAGSEASGIHYFSHSFALCELKLPPDFNIVRSEKALRNKEEKPPEDEMDSKARSRVFWGDL